MIKKLFVTNKIYTLLLIVIFFIALFLRFYNLSQIPAGLHIDEAITGDNANFILHTGHDTNNSFLPLQTEVFKDYNPTGYAYLAILPIKFFGLTEFATRFPGALFGSLTIFALFFLVYLLFKDASIAILSAGLFALSPWDIIISRSSEEAALGIPFVVLGFALLIKSIQKERVGYLVGACIALFLSYFMYFSPRFFVPLLFFSFFIPWRHWWKKRHEKFTKLFFASFILLGSIAIFLVFGVSGGKNRFNQVSIFGFPETKLVQAEQIREDGIIHGPIIITRIFHNKIMAFGYTYISNYLEYFSPDFLFIRGGYPAWLRVPQMGLFYLIELPFILFGIYRLVVEKKKWPYFLFAWLLFAPVAAALTVDDIPNVRRGLSMIPVLETFAAYGILQFFVMIPKRIRKLSILIVVLLFIFNVLYFIHAYFIHAQIHKNWYRNEGYKTMVADVKKVYNQYDHIIITKSYGGIFSELLFYMNYDPATYLKQGLNKDAIYTGFGKFFFVPGSCPATNGDGKIPHGKNLYVEIGTCNMVKGVAKQEYINRLDGTRVFHLVYE